MTETLRGHLADRLDDEGSHCEIAGCESLADYEGWHRQRDGMGCTTGTIQLRRFCTHHAYLLIGGGDGDRDRWREIRATMKAAP